MRVGRPPAKDPVISKSVALKASQWYQIEQSSLSRKAFFSKMFDRIDSYIQEIEDLKNFDVRTYSVSRLLALASNKALDNDRADIHMKILDVRDEI
jgi:hypothetical protein|tara:strand:+ start:357 stop:644 length:288 start_codon:yes stop_codon:yes gene_type:complete